MLLVLLVRGLTLPGALDGIKFYLWPDPTRLADPQAQTSRSVLQLLFPVSLTFNASPCLSYTAGMDGCWDSDILLLCHYHWVPNCSWELQ